LIHLKPVAGTRTHSVRGGIPSSYSTARYTSIRFLQPQIPLLEQSLAASFRCETQLRRNLASSRDVEKLTMASGENNLNAKQAKRILIAAAPASAQVLSSILESDFELIFTDSIEHAGSHLGAGIDLIACDTHFDDCRMFDLLRLSKANPATRPIPFVCLRVVEGALDQTLYQSVDIASSALGAAAFIDLFELKRKSGDEQAHKRLNRLIAQLASRSTDF
jgi:CheY-like chemotaxis protein